MTPTDDDQRLVNDASNLLQLTTDVLLPPTVRPGGLRHFVQMTDQPMIDHVTRTYRQLGRQQLANDYPGYTIHDPDQVAFKIQQSQALEQIENAILNAAQEDRFS